MITVVEGRPGMGKTIYLVSEILNYLNWGHHVYTNVTLTLPDGYTRSPRLHQIDSLEDIVNLRSGKIVLDEVQTYLNSRNWDKLDIRFQLLLQQHRKRGLDILGATQSVKRADVVFRELIQNFYAIRKIAVIKIPFAPPIGFFYIRQYDPDSVESATRSYDPVGYPSFFVADPFIFKVYDTTQEYQFQSAIGKIVTEKYVITEKKTEVKQLLSKQVNVQS